MSVLDFLHSDLSMSLRSPTRLGSAVFAFGTLKLDPLVSILDAVHMNFFLSLRSMACLGFVMFASDFGVLGLLMFLRSTAWSGFALPALEFMHLELLVFARSFVCPGSLPLVLDCSCFDLPVSLQAPGKMELVLLVFGLTRVGFVFSLSVIDSALFGFLASLQSSAKLGLALLLADHVASDPTIPLHSFARSGSTLFVLDLSKFDPSLPLHQHARLGLTLSLCGLFRLGPFMPLFDLAKFELALSLRSSACPGPLVLILEFSHPDFLTFIHDFARLEFSLPTSGISRADFVFFLPVIDSTHLDLSILLRSAACLESALLVLDHSVIESSPFPHSFAQLGLFILVLFATSPGPALPLRQFAHVALSLSVFGLSQLGSFLPALDDATVRSSTSVRSFF